MARRASLLIVLAAVAAVVALAAFRSIAQQPYFNPERIP
jgi:hypothetical protein